MAATPLLPRKNEYLLASCCAPPLPQSVLTGAAAEDGGGGVSLQRRRGEHLQAAQEHTAGEHQICGEPEGGAAAAWHRADGC